MASPNELYDQAVDLRDKGDKPGASPSSRRPSRLDPNFAIGHGMLAKLYVDLAESDKAIDHAKKVVELEPDDTFSYTALSVIYQRCGKIPEAEHAKAIAFNKQTGWTDRPIDLAPRAVATWPIDPRLGLALRGRLPRSAPPRERPTSRGRLVRRRNQAELVDLYHHLHSHPELSFQEVETVAADRRGAEEGRGRGHDRASASSASSACSRTATGPTVLVRSDLDALPVDRGRPACPTPARSTTTDDDGKTVGVMHACGHDIHMTCLVGTARWLAEHKDRWSGTVVLIGQPAEEKIGGAKAMLDDGLYSGSRSPITPWPCTSPTTCGPARSPTPAARRWPARPRSTSSSRGKGGPRGDAAHDRSTRSSWPRGWSSTSRRSSAARSTRSTRRS